MSAEYTLAIDFRSGEVTHAIEKDRLVVKHAKDGRTESVPLTSIREINLRQEMPEVYSTFVRREGGSMIRIPSRHFRGLGQFDDRRAEYGAFVRELMQTTAKANASARFTAGSSLLYVLGWILVAVALVFTGLVIVGSIARGLPPLRLLFVLPIAFFTGLGFIRQGSVRTFDPASPPPELVPS